MELQIDIVKRMLNYQDLERKLRVVTKDNF